MVPFKTHTVTVHEVTESGKTRVRGAEVGSVVGQLTPSAAGNAYNQFGLELTRPWLFMCDAEDAALFQVGREVVHGSQEFVVKAKMTYSTFGRSDHSSVLLEVLGNAE